MQEHEEEMEDVHWEHQMEALEEAEEEMERAEEARLAATMEEEMEALVEAEEEIQEQYFQHQLEVLRQAEEAMERAENALKVHIVCSNGGTRLRALHGPFYEVREHEQCQVLWWGMYKSIHRKLKKKYGEGGVDGFDSPKEFHNSSTPWSNWYYPDWPVPY